MYTVAARRLPRIAEADGELVASPFDLSQARFTELLETEPPVEAVGLVQELRVCPLLNDPPIHNHDEVGIDDGCEARSNGPPARAGRGHPRDDRRSPSLRPVPGRTP